MSKKNTWFKHYNTAHEGQSMSQLWAENDTETIAFYWTILEMISRWGDAENPGNWTGRLSIFQAKLFMKSQRARRLLENCSRIGILSVSWQNSDTFKVTVANWSKFQENRKNKPTDSEALSGPRVKILDNKKLEVRAPSPKSQVLKYEIAFSEDYQKFKYFIETDLQISGGVLRKLPDIFLHFGDMEKFTSWWDGFKTGKVSEMQTIPERNRYVAGALLCEAGLKSEATA